MTVKCLITSRISFALKHHFFEGELELSTILDLFIFHVSVVGRQYETNFSRQKQNKSYKTDYFMIRLVDVDADHVLIYISNCRALHCAFFSM